MAKAHSLLSDSWVPFASHRCRDARPGMTRKCVVTSLPPLERRLAFLDEGPRGFAMFFRQARMDMMRGFKIEALVPRARGRTIEIFLHVAVSHARAACEPLCNLKCLLLQRIRRHDPVHEAETQGFVHVE